MPAMKSIVLLCVVGLTSAFGSAAWGQTLASGSPDKGDPQLETLIKKIEEQNTKIDALSQQILKLEQQVSSTRPGVMIGEASAAANSSSPGASSPAVAAPTPAGPGNAHVVAKGETLISIAKTNKVSVDELQKFNHIEDARKLQAGQTIMIPAPGAASPSSSPSSSPGE